jgi:hypothetical protein
MMLPFISLGMPPLQAVSIVLGTCYVLCVLLVFGLAL